MNADNFQKASNRTLITHPDRDIPQVELDAVLDAVGFSCGVDEAVEYLKKAVFYQRGLDMKHLDELYEQVPSGKDEFWEHWSKMDVPMQRVMPLWVFSGLIGETSEVTTLILNYVFTGEIDREKLKDEIFDIMWYVSSLCTLLDLKLNDVMEHNIAKLLERYPNGYSAEDSKNRKE